MDLIPQMGNSNWGPGWVTTLFLMSYVLTKIEVVVKTLRITIKFTFYLAVRNVKRQLFSRFVTGVQMFQAIEIKLIGIADLR